jgi:co-chaperonin GroES (HSP10)
MRYLPLADRVLVEPTEEARVTRGNIVIPDIATNHKLLAFGTVVAHGSGRINAEGKSIPLSVEVGDIVAYPRKEAQPIPLVRDDGSEFTLMMLREAQIVARVFDLPKATTLIDVAGAPLSIVPTSRGLPDSVYANRDELAKAKRDSGWPAEDFDDHVDEPIEH